MPVIPDEALSGGNFFKPEKLGLRLGDRKTFKILKAHTENKGKDGKILYSIAVRMDKQEGDFSMNKTALKALAGKLGKDTDSWIGASFDAVVITQNNPTSGQQVKAWTVDTDAITGAKGK